MSNEQNLVPLTTEKAREIGKMGGIASGKAKKRMRLLKDMVMYLSEKEITSEKNRAILRAAGIDDDQMTNGMAIAHNIITGALKNDHRSIGEYFDATGQRLNMNINQNINIEPPAPRLAKDESEKNASVDGHGSLLQDKEA